MAGIESKQFKLEQIKEELKRKNQEIQAEFRRKWIYSSDGKPAEGVTVKDYYDGSKFEGRR